MRSPRVSLLRAGWLCSLCLVSLLACVSVGCAALSYADAARAGARVRALQTQDEAGRPLLTKQRTHGQTRTRTQITRGTEEEESVRAWRRCLSFRLPSDTLRAEFAPACVYPLLCVLSSRRLA